MYNKLDIWDYVEFLANTRVKSFYPMQVVNALKLPLNEVIDELNNIVKSGNRISLQFEIRCDNCINILKIVDDFSDYIGKEIYCEECGEYIEISKHNIYLFYSIDREYKEHLKKKNQRNTSYKEKFIKSSSIIEKEQLNIMQLEEILSNINNDKRINLYVTNKIINYQIGGDYMSGDQYINKDGQVGAMGSNAKVENSTFIQNNNVNQNDMNLTGEDINKLKTLIDKINQESSDQIQKSEALMASAHLQSLIESVEENNIEEQGVRISAWKQWFKNASEKARNFISTSADLVNIGVGLMTILELSKGL